ncbi:hypothetical protein Tco_1227623 [Tanacetum coccineum]
MWTEQSTIRSPHKTLSNSSSGMLSPYFNIISLYNSLRDHLPVLVLVELNPLETLLKNGSSTLSSMKASTPPQLQTLQIRLQFQSLKATSMTILNLCPYWCQYHFPDASSWYDASSSLNVEITH